MKEAIITIVQDAEMTDGDGHPFSETLVYRVEFEGDFEEMVSSEEMYIKLGKVVSWEQLSSIQNAEEVLGKR